MVEKFRLHCTRLFKEYSDLIKIKNGRICDRFIFCYSSENLTFLKANLKMTK